MKTLIPIIVCSVVLALGVLAHFELLRVEEENWELEKSSLAATILIKAKTSYTAQYDKEPVKAQDALLRYLGAEYAASVIDPSAGSSMLETYGSIKLFLLYRQRGLEVEEQHYYKLAVSACQESGWPECGEDRFEKFAAFYECAFIRMKGLSDECHKLLRENGSGL